MMWVISHSEALGYNAAPMPRFLCGCLGTQTQVCPHGYKLDILPSEPLPNPLEVQSPVALASLTLAVYIAVGV